MIIISVLHFYCKGMNQGVCPARVQRGLKMKSQQMINLCPVVGKTRSDLLQHILSQKTQDSTNKQTDK